MGLAVQHFTKYKGLTRKKNIAIVTNDLLGATAGGVGTASFALAETLSCAGHNVTVLFFSRNEKHLVNFTLLQSDYFKKGIRLLLIPPAEIPIEGGQAIAASFETFIYLKQNTTCYGWEIIYFPDMQGLGHFSIQAKKTTNAFSGTLLCVFGHGTSAWSKDFNNQGLFAVSDLEYHYLEKLSIQNCDVFISPTFSTLNWLEKEKWKLPKNIFVGSYTVPTVSEKYSGQRKNLKDIVFFGRLEYRKGLDLFVKAIKSLDQTTLNQIKIIFLGNIGHIYKKPSHQWIDQELSGLHINYEIISHLKSKEALTFLKNCSPLIVIPTRSETFGYTLFECIEAELPVIASRIPVFEELIEQDSINELFFELDFISLKQKIEHFLIAEVPQIKRKKSNQQVAKEWIDWHDTFHHHPLVSIDKNESYRPLVSVCIPHKDRPTFLESCLESLKKQTYLNFEILIGDDGSKKESSLSYLKHLEAKTHKIPTRIFYFNQSHGPGYIRNCLGTKANGEYLFFMDDDNRAKPNEIEMFIQAIQRTGADIVTCSFERMARTTSTVAANDRPTSVWVPVGNAPALAFFKNVMGDTNSFIKTEVFRKLKGFNEEKGLAGEDMEFFIRACLAEHTLEVIPDALMLYSQHDDNYSQRTDPIKSVQTMMETFSNYINRETLKELIWFMRGIAHGLPEQDSKDSRWLFSNPALFNDPVEVRKAFPKSLLTLSAENFRKLIISNEQLQVRIFGDIVGLSCKGEDPSFILPTIKIDPENRILLQIELIAKKRNLFKVYFQTVQNPVYCEEQTKSFMTQPGRNVFHLIFGGKITGPLRIDPTSEKTMVALKSLTVLSELLAGFQGPSRPPIYGISITST